MKALISEVVLTGTAALEHQDVQDAMLPVLSMN
jgi:hypothetical protein